jgi:uncharacterized protein YbaR (Trm112 family)
VISEALLKILACPKCKGELLYREERLICPACKLAYPITDGIPVMLVDEAEEVAEDGEGSDKGTKS